MIRQELYHSNSDSDSESGSLPDLTPNPNIEQLNPLGLVLEKNALHLSLDTIQSESNREPNSKPDCKSDTDESIPCREPQSEPECDENVGEYNCHTSGLYTQSIIWCYRCRGHTTHNYYYRNKALKCINHN